MKDVKQLRYEVFYVTLESVGVIVLFYDKFVIIFKNVRDYFKDML